MSNKPSSIPCVSPPCDFDNPPGNSADFDIDCPDEILPEPSVLEVPAETTLPPEAGTPSSHPSPPCTSSSAPDDYRPMTDMELDELAAVSAANADANELLDGTEMDPPKSDANSSGHESSPSPAGSPRAAAAAVRPQSGGSNSSASNADAALEFLDMDIDPKDRSAASSPTSFRFLSQMEDPSISNMAHAANTSLDAEQTPVLSRHAASRLHETDCQPSTSAARHDHAARRDFECDEFEFGDFAAAAPLTCVHDCGLHSKLQSSSVEVSPVEVRRDSSTDDGLEVFIGGPLGGAIMHDFVQLVNPQGDQLEEVARKGSGRTILLSGLKPCDISLSDITDASFGAAGRSSCGPRALVNVLKLLHFDLKRISAERRKCFNVARSRALDAPLGDYLLSRSSAGSTHHELIDAMRRGTDNAVIGRPLDLNSDEFNLYNELACALDAGRVPVLTLNMQRVVQPVDKERILASEVADAWHHCIVVGVNTLERSVTTIEPYRVWRCDELAAALSGDRVRECPLVRGVLREACDARELTRAGSGDGMRPPKVTHVVIPAAYDHAVTVFYRNDSIENGESECSM